MALRLRSGQVVKNLEFRIENVELRKVRALQTVCVRDGQKLYDQKYPPAVDFLANQHGQKSLTVTPLIRKF